MSRNSNVLKGSAERDIKQRNEWNPVGHACECRTRGGWYIVVETISTDEYGEHDYIETVLAYSTDEAIEEIEGLEPWTVSEGST
jgi:hypothetical protein